MLHCCFDFLSHRLRSRLILFDFRLQTKPRPTIIMVGFHLLMLKILTDLFVLLSGITDFTEGLNDPPAPIACYGFIE